MTASSEPSSRVVDAPAAAGHALRPVVERPQDALVAVEDRVDLALVPDVVAGRDHVDARGEDRIGRRAVRPIPPATFSPLAVTKSMPRAFRSSGSRPSTAWRPGLPIMSPIIRTRQAPRRPRRVAVRRVAEPGPPDRAARGRGRGRWSVSHPRTIPDDEAARRRVSQGVGCSPAGSRPSQAPTRHREPVRDVVRGWRGSGPGRRRGQGEVVVRARRGGADAAARPASSRAASNAGLGRAVHVLALAASRCGGGRPTPDRHVGRRRTPAGRRARRRRRQGQWRRTITTGSTCGTIFDWSPAWPIRRGVTGRSTEPRRPQVADSLADATAR